MGRRVGGLALPAALSTSRSGIERVPGRSFAETKLFLGGASLRSGLESSVMALEN